VKYPAPDARLGVFTAMKIQVVTHCRAWQDTSVLEDHAAPVLTPEAAAVDDHNDRRGE